MGALLGAKLLVLLQHVDLIGQDISAYLMLALQGKTIVGALLGGLVGVELTKRWIGVKESTGDVFVYPLMAGDCDWAGGVFSDGVERFDLRDGDEAALGGGFWGWRVASPDSAL